VELVDPELADPALAELVFVDPEADPDPELVDPALVEPLLEALVGVLGVDPVLVVGVPAVPGIEPQGEVCADEPGVVLGFIVDGCVVLPGVGGFVDVAPGTGVGVVGVAVPGGVVVPGAFAPEAPALPEVPAGAAPPAGALCATIQTAQPRNIESKASFVADIPDPPICF
jgi:hypothetical protein